jgi:enoyl-CoA hydratase/carnithine racemase
VSVTVTRDVDAWHVSWESERANALSGELVERLHEVLDEAVRDEPPALVLRGGVRHFASGFDLDGLAGLSDAEVGSRFLRIGLLLDRLSSVSFLTVAAATGAAIGAGADLVAACDRRLALGSTTFAFPGSRFGVVLGTHRLASLVGHDRALDLVDGHRVPAADVGFVDVYDDLPSLDASLDTLLGRWVRTDPAARRHLLVATRPDHADAALAALCRSALRPGIVARIGVATSGHAAGPRPDSRAVVPRPKEYA